MDTSFQVPMENTVTVLKFRTLFSFCYQIKCWFSGLEFHNCFVRVAKRDDPDQTALSEAVLSGSVLFVRVFLADN